MLEVETRDLRVPRAFDQTGIPFAEDGQAVIKECFYTDKADPKIVHDESTTTDNALDAALDGAQELHAPAAGHLDGEQLHRRQLQHRHRQQASTS